MNLKKLFGLQQKEKKKYEYANILHIWEDDYLMIEILPMENLNFIKNETKRIKEFGMSHFDGKGYTDIAVIGEKSVKTIEKKIKISQIDQIFNKTDLQKIDKIVMQGVGLLEGNKAPIGYGSNKFAVILEGKTELLENIWITGRTETEAQRHSLKQGLKEFGIQFEFIGINWFKSEFYDLNNEKQIENFIKYSC